MNKCEKHLPPASTGQTHRKKYTTSKAYQSHGGRFVTGKIFILTDAIINMDLALTFNQLIVDGGNSRKGGSMDSDSLCMFRHDQTSERAFI